MRGQERGRCPQFFKATRAFRVQPNFRTIPPMRALNETTRRANASSVRVHCPLGFALRAASTGSLRRVDSKLASFARGFFAHARISAGRMFTSWWNRA